MRSRHYDLLVLTLWLTATAAGVGCAVKKPPPAADALKGVLPATTTVPPTWTAGDSAAGDVLTEWLKTFNDPQLQALVDEGLRNNLDLKAAGARIEVASALVMQARSLLFPQISVIGTAGLVGRRNEDPKDRSGIGAEISWELDLWGRVRAKTASARANEDAAEADLLHARQSLAAMIAKLWYHAILLERLRQTAEQAVAVYDELYKLAQTRNQIGQVGEQDVAVAGADLDRVRHRERVFATSLQQIVRGLEIVLGRYPADEVALATDLPPVPPPVPAGLPSELLERRPDLVAAERRVAAAFHSIQAAKAARLPRIALTAFGGRSTSELLRLAGIDPTFWKAGLDLLAPLFTGGAIRGQIDAATAEQEAALALFGQTALRAFSEVEIALASEELLADQQGYLERVVAQDSEALRLGRIRFDVGAVDLFHVLELQARQLNSRFELLGVRNDRLANRVALHLALGGGFATP